MLDSTFKIIVLSLSVIVLIGNFHICADQCPKNAPSTDGDCDKYCADKENKNDGNGKLNCKSSSSNIGSDGNSHSIDKRKSSNSAQSGEHCLKPECIGKCEKPSCQRQSTTNQQQNDNKKEKCANKQCKGLCGFPKCKPKPCISMKCSGECNKSGCKDNKLGAIIEKCASPPASDDCSSKLPPQKYLSGNLNCQKLLPKEETGPIFTSSSDNLDPVVQCSRCNLQLTPDNAAVILTCYDCSNLKRSCGGDRTSSNSQSSRASTDSACSDKRKVKCSRDKQENTPGEQEISNPLVYQAYYLEIANYTETKRNK